MSGKTTLENTQPAKQAEKKHTPFSIFNKPILLSSLVFILLAALFTVLIYERYQLARENKEKEAMEVIHQAKDRLQGALTQSLSATKILAFLIDKNGEINNFDSIAVQIMESARGIDVLQLVPDGVIKYVYPLRGNAGVIGYNILKDTLRNKEAYKAIEQKKLFFAGPFNLKQGGMGVVGRLPVFRQNKFWGFSAVVIKMETLYKTVGIDSFEKKGYYFQLSKINPENNQEEFFLPEYKGLSGTRSVSVYVPDGEWKLSVTNAPSNSIFRDVYMLALLGLVLSVLVAIFTYRIAVRPKKLNELVLSRTSELKDSENNYRSLVERVSDAFVALDNNWRYTYVNEKAGELLGREPKNLIGKNIWKEFPEAVDQPFYLVYHRAMETQEYQYFEEYYALFDKWLESDIYPSKDGLTVFFKDVTEIKQISLALKNNEEKYRNLIEQASDGIVITDMEGIILEVNNSMQQMTGLGEEDLIGFPLTSVLPDDEKNTNPLRIHELMQGKSLLYERKLKGRNGSVMDVEINSKMASSHTLIGFIRDITERNKIKERLIYQASLLESVSDAVTSLDMNRNIVSWNNACEELYGFTAEEVIGRRVPDLITFEYPNTNNEEVFKQVFAEGKWKGEFNFIHPKSKEKINLLSNINLLKDNKGQGCGFIITSKNITDRIKAEEEIRKSNERFELIARATNDAVWDHDFTKNETWGNAKLYKIYGLEPGSRKIDMEMFMEHVHPEERNGIEMRMKEALDKKAETLSEVFRFKTAGSGYRTFYDRSNIRYDEAGKPVRILGAMQDITEREEAQQAILKSEAKYRTIIEQAADGIFIADENTNLLDVNSAGCSMSGYTKAELQQMKFIDFIPPEDLVTNPLRIIKLQKGQSVTNERRLIHKDGTIVEVEISAQKLLDGRFQLFVRNIDERKKAEEILEESERFLKETQLIASLGTYTLDITSGKWESSDILNEIFGIDHTYNKTVESWENIVHPEWKETMRSYFMEEVIGKKQKFDKEYKIIRKNDEAERWVHGLGTLKFNEAGVPVTMVGTIRDITTGKQAAEELLHSEQKYRLLFYDNPLPMWMTTIPELDFIDVNESAIKQYGYSREEFLKMNIRDLRLAEDLPDFMKELENMKPGEINAKACRHKKKNGTIIHAETYSHQIIYEGKPVWLSLANDVTDKNKAEEKLQKSYQDIRQLAFNLQNIREQERTNIAREIHDELGQQLTGLKMDIYWLSRKIDTADTEITNKLRESLELINATVASVRKIATDLRPSILDDLGLIAALEWQGEEFEKRSGTQVEFINEAGDFELKPESVTAVFRIFQELLTNVARHANATLVKVLLKKTNDSLFFSLTDNGVGFDPESISKKKTLGLLGIKERTLLLGGTYEFKSKAGEGSETIISIPLVQ